MNVRIIGTDPTRLLGDSQVTAIAKDMVDCSEIANNICLSHACNAAEPIPSLAVM